MNWKKELSDLIEAKSWEKALCLMEDVVLQEDGSIDSYLNYIFLLETIALYADFGSAIRGEAQRMMPKAYAAAKEKYADNPDFLFFFGFLLVGLVDRNLFGFGGRGGRVGLHVFSGRIRFRRRLLRVVRFRAHLYRLP